MDSYPGILSSAITSYRNGRNKRPDTQEESPLTVGRNISLAPKIGKEPNHPKLRIALEYGNVRFSPGPTCLSGLGERKEWKNE